MTAPAGLWLRLGAIAALALVTLVVTIGVGEYPVAPDDVALAMLGLGDPGSSFVVTELRLPRALTALAVGAALGMAGALLQGLTRNPLAAPELVGVSAGANAAAVLVFVVWSDLPVAVLPAFAFGGALAASLVVAALAWGDGASSSRVLLVGVSITTIGYAVVVGIVSSVDDLIQASQLVTFLAGTVYGRGWAEVTALVPWLLVLGALALLSARRLDALALGDDVAAGLGVRLDVTRAAVLALAAGLAGAAVAVAGPVGFVGLTAPHMARRLVGPHHGRMLLAAALLGGTVVLIADALARTAFAPIDVPVGVVTAVVGAPYLLWLLARRGR